MSISNQELNVRTWTLAIAILLITVCQALHFQFLSARIKNTADTFIEILAEREANHIMAQCEEEE